MEDDGAIANKPWSFNRFEHGWIYLSHLDTVLRVRFWPNPCLQVSDAVDGWGDVSHLGDALLARSGFFKAAEGHGLCLVGYRPLANYLGVIDAAQADRLPGVDFECETSEEGVVLMDARRQLCFPFELLARQADRAWKTACALDLAIACIPRAIRRRLPYFGWSPWALLEVACKCPAVADLMVSNPMLLTLWIRRVAGDFSLFEREVVPQLRLKQREQLAICGEVPASQTVVNILRKIPLEEMYHIPAGIERRLSGGHFTEDVMCHFKHRSIVTAFEVQLAMVGKMIQTISAGDQVGGFRLARLIQVSLRRMPRPRALRLPPCLSKILKEVERLETLIYVPTELQQWRVRLPFKCPKGWEHLDSIDAVVSEGVAQQNCLVQPARYLKERVFLFRVNHPVRATVRVDGKGRGFYEVVECTGYRNRTVEPDMRLIIKNSLRKALAHSQERCA
ncbi:hypothetical protein ACWPKO_04040 [Coraliomargarita sp. W4R53]